jgi:hypothetical protein
MTNLETLARKRAYGEPLIDLAISMLGSFPLLQSLTSSHAFRMEEIATPYLTFKEAGLQVTVASVKGGKIPVDAGSLDKQFVTPDVTKFMNDGARCSDTCPCTIS